MADKRKPNGKPTLPFGTILKRMMKERGLTIRQIAKISDTAPSVVQSWLELRTPHDLMAVSRLANYLGVSFRFLLLGENEPLSESHDLSLHDEVNVFDGLAKVSITRLVPRSKKDSS